MARKFGVRVEDLEGRTLLSGISYVLTTDHSVYQAGQPVQITFTETNTGTQPVTVSLSPTDFTVSASPGRVQPGLAVEPGERWSAAGLGDAPAGAVRDPDGDLERHDHGDRLPAGHRHDLRGEPVGHVPGLES